MSKIQVPLSILTLVGFLVFLNACTSQNEQDKFPVKLAPGAAVTCYTGTEPSYKIDVKPLIVSKCNACHAADVAAGAGGGYIYETYDQISANAIVIMQRVQLPATGERVA